MTKWSLSIFLMLFYLQGIAHAQTSDPAPVWPPDPDAIFAEGVAWTRVQETVESSVEIDEGRRLIRLYDAGKGTTREYAFPADVLPEDVHETTMQPNGLIRVSIWNYGTLLLNPETGMYEAPQTVCNGLAEQAEPDQGVWVLGYESPDNDHMVLCQTETSEMRDVLPEDFEYGQIFSTPDESNLLLVAIGTYEYRVFSYHLSDDQLILLGTLNRDSDDVLSVCNWFSESQGVLCNSNTAHAYFAAGYYAVNTTQENSLAYLFSGWQETMMYLREPKRYIAMFSGDYFSYQYGSQSGSGCFVSIYDLEGVRTQSLGSECIPRKSYEYGIEMFYESGTAFYVLTREGPISQADRTSAVSSLYRFDALTEILSEPLLTAEIETILSISPDERYIVLALDTNGKTDFPWNPGKYACCRPYQIVILDLHSGHIIYRSDPIDVRMADQVEWLDDTTVFITAGSTYDNLGTPDGVDENDAETMFPFSLRRIHIEEDLVTTAMTTRYEEDVWSSVHFYKPYWMGKDNIIVNLNTFDPVPLLQDDMPTDYNVYVDWQWEGPGDVSVKVVLKSDSEKSVSYTVTLP